MLTDALRTSAPARALHLMARVQSALKGEVAARPWLERAAAAPRDDEPAAAAFVHITGDGWRRLVRDYMDHGRLAPAPLEAPPPGLPEAELAPAPPEAPPDPPPAGRRGDLAEEAEAAAGDDPDTEEILGRGATAARAVN